LTSEDGEKSVAVTHANGPSNEMADSVFDRKRSSGQPTSGPIPLAHHLLSHRPCQENTKIAIIKLERW
jgi:hypothetical protein